MLSRFLISVSLTVCVSTILGLIVSDSFWYVFTLAAIIQIAGFLLFQQIYTNRLVHDFEEIKIQQIKESSRNLIEVSCPCDEENTQTVDFRFDRKNICKCTKCGKNFTIMSTLRTVMTTDPIYFDSNG
tara:strand:- start:215 stop:598 length:384 start_codon:yes stop_codon:yes gene_type:complete